MKGDGAAIRAYGALLRLYPRRFRDQYGDDMVLLMREQRTEESAPRVFARSMIDLAISIPTQHLEARMHRAPSPLVPLAYATAAVAGLLVAIVGGTNWTMLVLGLSLAVVAGAVAVAAWRRSSPVSSPRTFTASWWKFLVAGPCLVVLVIVGAGVGLEAWYLGLVVVFAAFVSAATGLVLGLAHLFFTLRLRGTAT
jgi:hypothetical protein